MNAAVVVNKSVQRDLAIHQAEQMMHCIFSDATRLLGRTGMLITMS